MQTYIDIICTHTWQYTYMQPYTQKALSGEETSERGKDPWSYIIINDTLELVEECQREYGYGRMFQSNN